MNTVKFFGRDVSRIIIGDNPITGHSYIVDKTTGQEMIDFYTAEKILETLFEIERLGITAMLPIADPFMIRLLSEYERSGGKLQWIFQPYMPMNQEVSIRQIMGLRNTIGIYHQGTTTDYCFETGKCAEILERLKLYHTMGIPVGLGTHRPDVVETCVREGWDVDFFVACMQNARRNREGEPSGFITGKTKAKLIFRPGDRPVMLECLRRYDKPVIAFKIFAGGQMFLGKTEEQIRAQVRNAYNEVFTALKPDDIAAIGVFQRDKDELREDVEVYEEWRSETQRPD